MQSRYKSSNGVLSKANSCDGCGITLTTDEEVSAHESICNGVHKGVHKSQAVASKSSNSAPADDRFKKWENQILAFGQAFCDNQECNYVGMTLSGLKDHVKSCIGVPNFSLFCCIHCRCGFSNKEDHLKHQQNCNVTIRFDNSVQKRGDGLHFRVIKKMKSDESCEEHIIQPMPDFPKGQYRRRRPYSVQHIKSWVLSLEKLKYVKCIYQNCYFIAMSLEDMISHFGYCNGDGGFAKFVCPYCNGRVTSEPVLYKHIERSHPLENNHIVNSRPEESDCVKVEPEEEEGNERLLFTDMESQSAREAYEKTQKNFGGSQELNEVTKTGQTACWKVWRTELNEFGYAFCRKYLCNFMAPSIPLLEVHLRSCDGTPDFDYLNCPKCRHRLPTKEDLDFHIPRCKEDRMKYYPTGESERAVSPSKGFKGFEDSEPGPVFRKNERKALKFYSKQCRTNPNPPNAPEAAGAEESSSRAAGPEEDAGRAGKAGREESSGQTQRRSRSSAGGRAKAAGRGGEVVKCGKCGKFEGSRKGFEEHNLKTHTGLGWVEGEVAVDMSDEKLVIRLVKEAFKVSKRGMCENCDDVKRSVLGFVSHIQNCGKTEEEKDALKVQCSYCDGKYLKYSLSTHLKLCHAAAKEKKEKNESAEQTPEPSGKRRSAIRAASKFQQVLDDSEEADTAKESRYIVYEKGSEKVPKLNPKLTNLWYKLKREKKKIVCRHSNCLNVSNDVQEAKNHHYSCPLLPDRVFLCELCDFYSVDEPAVKNHVTTHRKYSKRKANGEDEEVKMEVGSNDEEEEEEEEEGADEEELEGRSSDGEEECEGPGSGKLKRKRSWEKVRSKRRKHASLSVPVEVENQLKQSFCKRERIDSLRGTQFYSNGLDMTLEEEVSKTESRELWAELHSSHSDWVRVPPRQALRFFPELTESVSFRFGGSSGNWRRLERFGSDVIEGVPVMFTGGSVRSMSWCKVSFRRTMEKVQKQYLAVSTSWNAEQFRDIHDRSSLERASLLQIWDCGVLGNAAAQEAPKFSLGIAHKGGEIWDVAWFPEDTRCEGSEERLERLGLLATASEDGVVRVWSICNPDELDGSKGLPVYTTEPRVVLTADEDVEEGCVQLAVGRNGVLAGGFGNGAMALWNLGNLSSPFCKSSGKSKAIRAHLVVHAHRAAITAMVFCPLNSRYISTAGLDRFVKVWDTEFPSMPMEQYNKECSLDNIWTLNWPSLIYNFDDVILNFNRGAVKFVKDIVTERHQSTFVMGDTCLSLSFSDWLNSLCGGSITGEVKLRLLKNLVHDQKRFQSTLSSVRLEKLAEGATGGKAREADADFPRSYAEVKAGFGLVFRDNLGMDKGKPKKPEAHPDAFPIRAVNKVAFNPNLKSFTHIAVGYNCGLIRIQALRELQSSRSVKLFLERTEKRQWQ